MALKKKRLRDCSYAEFSDYTNYQAGVGMWSMFDAIICIEVRSEVENRAKKKFFPWLRKKDKERLFKEEILKRHIEDAIIEWE